MAGVVEEHRLRPSLTVRYRRLPGVIGKGQFPSLGRCSLCIRRTVFDQFLYSVGGAVIVADPHGSVVDVLYLTEEVSAPL